EDRIRDRNVTGVQTCALPIYMDYLEMFLTAKQIEGCSGRTIQYYKATIENFLQKIENPLRKVNTEMIRQYLSDYQAKNECSKVKIGRASCREKMKWRWQTVSS